MNCCFHCLSEQIHVAVMYMINIKQNILQGVLLSCNVMKHCTFLFKNQQGRITLTDSGTKQIAFHWRQEQIEYEDRFKYFWKSHLGSHKSDKVVLIKRLGYGFVVVIWGKQQTYDTVQCSIVASGGIKYWMQLRSSTLPFCRCSK